MSSANAMIYRDADAFASEWSILYVREVMSRCVFVGGVGAISWYFLHPCTNAHDDIVSRVNGTDRFSFSESECMM